MAEPTPSEQIQQILAEAEADVKQLLQKREGQPEGASIRLVIHVVDADTGTSAAALVPTTSFIVCVGAGTQTFKWLSLAVRSAKLDATYAKGRTSKWRKRVRACMLLPCGSPA
jgi:hypothetical protein